MGRRLQVDWKEDAETLRSLYLHETSGEVRTRLHALWLLRTGRQAIQVAADLGVAERTIREWVRWYRRGAIEEVRRHSIGGLRTPHTPCRLTDKQQEELRDWTRQGVCFRVADAMQWVRQKYGVDYSYWGMWKLLRRMKLRLKRPRELAKGADTRAQAAWREGAQRSAWGASCSPHGYHRLVG